MITVCETPGSVSLGRQGGGGGDERAHSRHDLVDDAQPVEGAHLLADGAVQAGVAGVQAHDPAAGAVGGGHQAHLLVKVHAGAVVAGATGGRPVEQGDGHERTRVEHDVGRLEQAPPLDGDELRVSRPGADEPDHVRSLRCMRTVVR